MILGTIAIIAGIIFIRFRKSILKDNYAWQKENLGLKFNRKQIRIDDVIAVGIGSIVILAGVLLVLGVLKVR